MTERCVTPLGVVHEIRFPVPASLQCRGLLGDNYPDIAIKTLPNRDREGAGALVLLARAISAQPLAPLPHPLVRRADRAGSALKYNQSCRPPCICRDRLSWHARSWR